MMTAVLNYENVVRQYLNPESCPIVHFGESVDVVEGSRQEQLLLTSMSCDTIQCIPSSLHLRIAFSSLSKLNADVIAPRITTEPSQIA